MAEKLITKSFERLLDKGKHRGFITHEELGKSLGKRNSTPENIEKALIVLVEEKVTLVEKKSQYQSNKKKEPTNNNEEKSSEKSDDPIRMYLREMGGVELLSREGEIAIAKRIEAGKDVMINALTQSPIVGKKIKEWREQIESQQLLVRDIIDIDSTYEDFESSNDDDESRGDLRLCLFGNTGISVRHLLQKDDQLNELKDLILKQMQFKKESHYLELGDTGSTKNLSKTGG